MKMYLPFGDWSDDGHGKWDKLLRGTTLEGVLTDIAKAKNA